MTQAAEKLLHDAMSLDDAERAELAAKLLDTLEPGNDADYAAAWQAEIEQRLSDLDSGKVQPVPWDQARQLIRGGEKGPDAH